jgi:gamma-glutamylcyclotransferase (GGCT)/AIG2-like uncharacterized protein YtfP
MPREYTLFVYGTELPGEPDHALLEGARPLGAAVTDPSFDLVDLGTRAGLVPGGTTAVHGELYVVPVETLAAIDRHVGHPVLCQRTTLRLAGGQEAEAYLLSVDQARARRRVRSGKWRERDQRIRVADGGPLVRWARGRHGAR